MLKSLLCGSGETSFKWYKSVVRQQMYLPPALETKQESARGSRRVIVGAWLALLYTALHMPSGNNKIFARSTVSRTPPRSFRQVHLRSIFEAFSERSADSAACSSCRYGKLISRLPRRVSERASQLCSHSREGR